jgi:ribonuclease P protein component
MILQKEYRLKNKRDFAIVYRFGKSVANHQFVLYHNLQSQVTHFRLGISTSKKLGNAVVRNRMRRLVKEIFRNNSEKIAVTDNLVIIVRRAALSLSYLELEKSLFHLMRKANLIRPFHK